MKFIILSASMVLLMCAACSASIAVVVASFVVNDPACIAGGVYGFCMSFFMLGLLHSVGLTFSRSGTVNEGQTSEQPS